MATESTIYVICIIGPYDTRMDAFPTLNKALAAAFDAIGHDVPLTNNAPGQFTLQGPHATAYIDTATLYAE